MAMPFSQNEKTLRTYFSEMKELFEMLRTEYPRIIFLSMGMSQDYKIAVEEGSNIVRIGTAIFGERNYKK